jgi:hypothetical protein
MRNKAYSILLFAGILAILVPMGSAQGFSGAGSGTEQDPYIITNVYQLQEMNNDLDAWYELGNDIDASATRNWNWNEEEGIYKGFSPVGGFTGHFDGRGHIITHLYINRTSVEAGLQDIGLFGYVMGSEIKNVGLLEVDITGGHETGALVANNDGGISHAYSTGRVKSVADFLYWAIGGLVGLNHDGATIINSYSTASVSGAYSVGGLVGSNSGVITNCYSTGDVSGVEDVGGLVGSNGAGVCLDSEDVPLTVGGLLATPLVHSLCYL